MKIRCLHRASSKNICSDKIVQEGASSGDRVQPLDDRTCALDWVTFHISFSLFVNLEQFYILPGALNLSSTQCAEITGGSPSIQQNAFTFYSNQTEPNLIHIIFHLLPSHPRPSPCLPPCPPPCRPPCPPPSPPTPPPPTGPLPIHLTGSLNFTLPQSSSLSSMSSSLTAPY